MEFFKLIEKRYSVRKFTEDEVKKEDLKKIVHAASISASGKNIQNWHFVIVRNKELLKKMGDIVRNRVADISTHLEKEQAEGFTKFTRFSTFFEDAPAVICVYGAHYVPEGYNEMVLAKDDQENIDHLLYANPGIQGVGGAIEQMILAAFDLGYGACWMTSPNNSAKKLEEAIGYEDDTKKLIALVPIGVCAGERKSPKKKELSEISTWID